jgi:hypothetical protein
LHAYILYIIKHNNKNDYSWMRKIHKIGMMKIIVCANRTISRLLDKPKNLLSFEV